MTLTLTGAQRLLLGIITSVESDVTSPEDAVEELEILKTRAAMAGLPIKTDYTLADFQKIRENYVSTYESSEPLVEPSYESSDSY